ncbi:hypothetical protein C8Q75DRAFT_137795 [Abortiporus biennis]|nr:hypothetical protein C8Q75DRAFT_137795 [Abortiporus biennis]
MSNTSAPPFLNPNDPYLSIPPNVVTRINVANSFTGIMIAMWFGDFLNSLYEEYIMFSKHRKGFPDIVYVLARLACMGYCISDLIFVSSENFSRLNCQAITQAFNWFAGLSICITSLLFFFRIRAVFFNSPATTIGFFLLWLATCTSLIAPFVVRAITQNHNFCVISEVSIWTFIPFIVVAIHDTFVFFAINIRLTQYHSVRVDGQTAWQTFFSGTGMSTISKALLTTGQLYYLATIGVSVAVAISIMVSLIPVSYRGMLIVPDILLQNSMACRVYRHLKIGRLNEVDVTTVHGVRPRRTGDSSVIVTGLKFFKPPSTRTGTVPDVKSADAAMTLDDSDVRLEIKPDMMEMKNGIDLI